VQKTHKHTHTHSLLGGTRVWVGASSLRSHLPGVYSFWWPKYGGFYRFSGEDAL